MSGEIPGKEFMRGQEGDVRRGTCYGHRSAKEYNKVKIAQTEKEEGRKVVLLHYAKVKNDRRIERFYVVNGHLDPDMKVVSRAEKYVIHPLTVSGDPSKGTIKVLYLKEYFEEWLRFEMDGKYCFYPPASYDEGPISWFHNKDLGDESLVYESDVSFWIPNKSDAAQGLKDVGLTEVRQKPELVTKASGLILPPGADFHANADTSGTAGERPTAESPDSGGSGEGTGLGSGEGQSGAPIRGSSEDDIRLGTEVP
jgi:hypothetical protein